MSLFRLVYHSRNAFNLSMRPASEQFADILAISIVNNRRFKVTGGLIYDRDWFVQALEGDRDAVIGTFERIAIDRRHRDIVVTESRSASMRRFPDCWMRGIERPQWSGPALFSFSAPDAGFDPRAFAGDALTDLLETMVLQQASHRGRAWWTRRSDLTTE
jgi:hypothetical protein